MNILLVCIIVLIFSERMIKHWLVMRFFRRVAPEQKSSINLVSILQPILSGDPTMPAGLEQNLLMQTRYPLEFLWLVDEDDEEAKKNKNIGGSWIDYVAQYRARLGGERRLAEFNAQGKGSCPAQLSTLAELAVAGQRTSARRMEPLAGSARRSPAAAKAALQRAAGKSGP